MVIIICNVYYGRNHVKISIEVDARCVYIKLSHVRCDTSMRGKRAWVACARVLPASVTLCSGEDVSSFAHCKIVHKKFEQANEWSGRKYVNEAQEKRYRK